MDHPNRIRVTTATEIAEGDAERFYDLYEAAFGPLRTLGAARQVLFRDEFFAEMRDPRVVKYIAWSPDGRPIGLTAASTDLRTVPWISPDFFEARHPEQASRNAICYVHFMLAHPGERLSGCVDAMFAALVEFLVSRRAVALYDICAYNNDALRFGENIRVRLEAAASVDVQAVDSQTYYSAVFDGRPQTVIDTEPHRTAARRMRSRPAPAERAPSADHGRLNVAG